MDNDDWVTQDCLELNAFRVTRSDTMIHAELRALYTYWDELRAGRKTPLRSEIDPRKMRCDARNLFILENLGQGNIRFRLAGTAIVDAFGMELRGMNARAIMTSSARESFTALIAETLEDPGVGYARLRASDDEDVVWEVSLLPLRSDFGMIDRVIGCLHPLTAPTARGPMPLRFRIEHMNVEPVEATVDEPDLPTPIVGFAEPQRGYTHRPVMPVPDPVDERPRFTAIEGGRTAAAAETADRPMPTRGHLRLVSDHDG